MNGITDTNKGAASAVLAKAMVKLKSNYPGLMIVEGERAAAAGCDEGMRGESFLHIWRPLTRTHLTQGMTYLPCFHVVVTVKEAAGVLEEALVFTLLTFHGKTLDRLSVNTNPSSGTEMLEDVKIEMLSDLVTDNIHICQGIFHIFSIPSSHYAFDQVNADLFLLLLKFPGVQEVKERKWRSYLANASKMPVLEKVKSVFLIEPYEDDVILRSRTCRLE